MKILHHNGEHAVEVIFESGDDPATAAQLGVLLDALALYHERNRSYQDNWKRYGVMGCVSRVRERAERIWDLLGPTKDNLTRGTGATQTSTEAVRGLVVTSEDDLLDLVNLTGFALRALRDGNRGGEGDKAWWRQ